jgi:hypothetical protein
MTQKQSLINPATKNVTNRKQTQIIEHIYQNPRQNPQKITTPHHIHIHQSPSETQAPTNIHPPRTMKATLNPETHIGKPPNNQQKERKRLIHYLLLRLRPTKSKTKRTQERNQSHGAKRREQLDKERERLFQVGCEKNREAFGIGVYRER